jgi:hypothetical protein
MIVSAGALAVWATADPATPGYVGSVSAAGRAGRPASQVLDVGRRGKKSVVSHPPIVGYDDYGPG